jgi:hypothetical protein
MEVTSDVANQPRTIRKGRPKKGELKFGRSRVGNGGQLLPGVDGRSRWVRRAKDIISEHLSDLGGVANTSAADRSLVKRIAALTVELERLEVHFATNQGTDAEMDLYVRASGCLRRYLSDIGLERRARDVTPTLSTYLDEHHDAKHEEEAA